MYKFQLCTLLIGSSLLIACSKNPLNLTAEQQWQRFCTTYQGAAYNIMHDRQNGVEYDKALAHAEKLPEGKQRELILALLKTAYQQPQHANFDERQKAKEQFRQGKMEYCMTQQPKT